jgi:hypothetical protein
MRGYFGVLKGMTSSIQTAPDLHKRWSDFDDPWRALAWAMKMVVLPLNTALSWCCELEGQIGVGGRLGHAGVLP